MLKQDKNKVVFKSNYDINIIISQTNNEILSILILQFIMCLFASLSHAIWYKEHL